MECVLKELDFDCNLKKWTFICNSEDDIPQQGNTHDCDICTCLYARCLVELGPMVQECCFSALRRGILYSLHKIDLHEIAEKEITVEKYYAVDYITNYCIGRALSIKDHIVQFKYLYRVDADRFAWARRDDIDNVHISCVFYLPVALEHTGPFVVPMQQVMEKVFKATR